MSYILWCIHFSNKSYFLKKAKKKSFILFIESLKNSNRIEYNSKCTKQKSVCCVCAAAAAAVERKKIIIIIKKKQITKLKLQF